MATTTAEFRVDLDQLLRDFNDLEQSLLCSSRSTSNLTDENKQLKAVIEKEKAHVQCLENDLQMSYKAGSTLRTALQKRCDSDDDNRILKQTIKALEEQLESVKAEAASAQATAEAEKQAMQKQFDLQHNQLKEEFNQRAEREMLEWRRVSDAQERTIDELKRRVATTEKDQQAEVKKMRLEFDAQLQTIQKQNAETSSAASKHDRELYRKKVQQLRAESQKEIADLRATLAKLQHELNFYQQPVPTSKPVAGRTARFTNRR